jgi:hypothetical protein
LPASKHPRLAALGSDRRARLLEVVDPRTSLTPPKVVYASSMFTPASASLRATCAMVPGAILDVDDE